MSLKVKLNTESLKLGDQLDASRKRKSDGVHDDDASTVVGDDGALIRRLLEKINPFLLDIPIEADSPKKTSQSTLSGYLNDSQGSLFALYDALRRCRIDGDCELAISVINSIVAQRKAKLPPAESVVLPTSSVHSELDKLEHSKPRYALHQSWPDANYFTQASELDPQVASKLALGEASLARVPVQCAPKLIDSPKLKDISLPSPHTNVKSLTYGTFRNKDVSHLYYGTNYSFGPSHDSTLATIPYSTSLNIATTSKMKGVEDPTMIHFKGQRVPIQENKEITNEQVDNTGIEDLPAAYDSLNKSHLETQTKLKRNAFLLAKLKSLEAHRLRSTTPYTPSKEEESIALKLTHSFTEILVHEPPWQYCSTDQLRRLHPKGEMAQYYGNLDSNPEHSHMLVDNIAVLPEAAELRKMAKQTARM
ncbi:hypothetical protein E3P91_04096 [Wallemia ichthyophaga]|nr:hypothetical protein E3P91_04096 [Wallemia ichthyophaga]TIB57926.1 hypothetical protein E3P78_04090 [Wallemia ichthyophaga]